MTVLPMSVDGLAEISAALRAGEAVVIPFPSPLPYVVAGTRATTVNEAKGRPSGQPCGILVSAPEDVAAYLDLDAATVRLSMWIAVVERANLLVPVLSDAPPWLREGSVAGYAGITLAWLPQTRPIADRLGHLFASSGNLTSRPAAVTAPEADKMFGGRRLVLDGDRLRDPDVPHGSATMIEVRRGGLLRVVRDGINNRPFAGDSSAYIDSLRDRFRADRRGHGSAP